MDALSNGEKSVALVSKITWSILGFLTFLIPIFFIPGESITLSGAKSTLFTVGVVVAFTLFVISLIQEGRLFFPKNLLTLSIVLLPVSALLSSLFTNTFSKGFVGFGLEVSSVVFFILAALLTLLTSYSFKSKERVFYAYVGFFVSFIIVALFQVVRLASSGEALSFGLFTSSTTNLVGSWNDLAVFFGLSTIVSLVTLEMLQLNRLFKFLTWAIFLVSLIFLAIVNFVSVWWVLGSFSIVFFLYVVSFDHFARSREFAHDMSPLGGDSPSKTSVRKVSFLALFVLLVSLTFIAFGSSIGENIAQSLEISSIEVRPSWGTTFSVLGDTLKSSVLFGSGPNNFALSWGEHKPLDINETMFWNTDFLFGIGLIPSMFVMTGLVGILAWLLFFILFVWKGIKAMFASTEDLFSRYITVSSFFGALFLWVLTIVYVPGFSMVALAFFFTGLFIASLYRENMLKEVNLSLAHHPKLSFISVFVLVVLLLGSISLGYLVLQKTIAISYFQKGLLAAQRGDSVDVAEQYIVKAINTYEEDVFYRALSEIKLVRVDQALFQENASAEFIREQFQINTANAIENARRATVIAGDNYQNWISLARVYAALVPPPFSIPGAYDNAKKTYEEAQKRSPKNPNIPLLLARLEVSNNNLTAARQYVDASIALKSNYAEAHFLSAQIAVTEGNAQKATQALETTLILSPNNPGLFFQLGLLKYNDRNWNGAIEAFRGALSLVPEYANARYFLGLALERTGDKRGAIEQFSILKQSNPENGEVALILSNLEAGKPPFTGIEPPLDNRPEKRETLPIGNN